MTLTELSYYLRKFLPIAIIFGLFFLIIYYSFKLYFAYLEANKPKQIITPTVFGRIEAPIIKNATTSANFSFTLDNIEGRPVTTTDSAKVYFIPKPATRFGYREKVYLMAKTLAFDTNISYKLVDNFALFEQEKKKLKVDITNYNFTYESLPNPDTLINSQANIPNQEKEIIDKATDFLKKINRYPDELIKGTTHIVYVKYNPNLESYVNVSTAGDANLVEVDFFRQYPDGVAVVSPKFFNSQNYVVMMFDKNDYIVVKAQIAHFEKSDTQYDLYPVKSADLAWDELIKGKGKVVAATIGKKDIVIKDMYIAYYDSDEYQSFLQPVYVFLGDNDFVAYLPAISSSWLIDNN
ncbi:MAG: hypothetical protein Fur009_2060 [Candidatus Microgenomates bacterium]